MQLDLNRLGNLDRAITGGALLAFLTGFLPWWGYSGPLGIYGASVDGWSSGFSAWAGILLLTLAGLYLALRRFEVAVPALPLGPAVVVAGTAGLGLALVVIRWATLPRVHAGLAGSIGSKYGIWLAIVAGAVEVGAAVLELRASGEPLPWQQAHQS